jgi:hypothetical protein
MAEFDFSAVRNNLDMADALGLLKQGLSQARETNAIDKETEAAAQSYLSQAIREVNMPVPSKTTVLDHLDSAKECLSSRAAVGSIVDALTQASETVQRMF